MFKNLKIAIALAASVVSASVAFSATDSVTPDMVSNIVVDESLEKTPLVRSAVKIVEKVVDEGFIYFNIDNQEYRLPTKDFDATIKQGDAFSVMYGAVSALEGKGATLVITDKSTGFRFYSQTIDYTDIKSRIEHLLDRDSRMIVQGYQVMSPMVPMAETYEDILSHPDVQFNADQFNDL